MKIKPLLNSKLTPLSSIAPGDVFAHKDTFWIKGIITTVEVTRDTNLKTGYTSLHSYDLEVIPKPNAILLPEGE